MIHEDNFLQLDIKSNHTVHGHRGTGTEKHGTEKHGERPCLQCDASSGAARAHLLAMGPITRSNYN